MVHRIVDTYYMFGLLLSGSNLCITGIEAFRMDELVDHAINTFGTVGNSPPTAEDDEKNPMKSTSIPAIIQKSELVETK